jgi:Domain of unknown function (DUF4395)
MRRSDTDGKDTPCTARERIMSDTVATPSLSTQPIYRRDFGARVFSFPNPVNEVSARLVAGGVVLMSLATIVLGQPWLTAVIAYGFIARVLSGPTLSPLGQLVTRVITPRLHVDPRPVPGPPKRFAQAIGVVFSASAAVLALGFGLDTAAYVVLGLLIVAATLESVFGLCLGCKAFAALMRAGLIPSEVCERCNDITGGA